jgi:type I restriction enzyme S subunit
MEKTGGILMVEQLKWTTVSSEEVQKAKFRLEASVFDIEAKKAIHDVAVCKFPKKKLIAINGEFTTAHYGGRIKRNYISKTSKDAIGFLGSSEMLQIKPNPEKFLSSKNNIDQFRVNEGTVLISRSGTIGNLILVNKTLSKYLVSEHAIRLIGSEHPGFAYAFLKSKTGQLIIQSKIFGAVVDQIEPEHLADIEIPNPPKVIKGKVNDKILKSFDLRDKSNELIENAEQLLVKALKLKPIEKLKPDFFKPEYAVQNYIVPLNLLDDRFDGSYHIPIVNCIIDCLLDNADKVLPLSDRGLTSKITLPGRFKRHYVKEGDGTVFLGGKQIYELDPYNKKYLSVKFHGSRIEGQLFLKENMIAITCSGTIGKVNLIPKHWENWTMSQHVMRAVPIDKKIAGYLYIWLSSEYGRILIERQTYGSVIDEIDVSHLSKIPVPILKDKDVTKKINDLALEANKLRSEAYYLEQFAIDEVNEKVIFA